MSYTPTTWQGKPSTATPITAARLNKLENGLASAAAVADEALATEGAEVTADVVDPIIEAYLAENDPVTAAKVNAVVADSVANSSTNVATAVQSKVTSVARRDNTIVTLGASFTEGNYGPGTGIPLRFQARGYFNWAQLFLGQRFNWVKNAGIPGNTTANMLARVDADVIALNPSYCLVETGPNDITGNRSVAAITADIASIVSRLRAAGISVAVTTPTTTAAHTAAQVGVAMEVGAWLRRWVATQKGVTLIDFAEVWCDPATGKPVTALTDDGTHPSPVGAMRLGRAVASAYRSVPELNRLPASNVSGSLLTNGMQVGNVAGLPTGAGINGAGTSRVQTPTKVARTDGIPGEWAQMATGPANRGEQTFNFAQATTGWSVGETVEAFVEWRILPTPTIVVDPTDVSSYVMVALLAIGGSGEARSLERVGSDKPWTEWPTETVVSRIPPMVIPPGTTGLLIQVRTKGFDTMTIQVGRAALYKVT